MWEATLKGTVPIYAATPACTAAEQYYYLFQCAGARISNAAIRLAWHVHSDCSWRLLFPAALYHAAVHTSLGAQVIAYRSAQDHGSVDLHHVYDDDLGGTAVLYLAAGETMSRGRLHTSSTKRGATAATEAGRLRLLKSFTMTYCLDCSLVNHR